MRLTFSHPLRTSRRFLFENIVDLQHVCVVHRRWFRNLRVRVQRPDYVEYRLTGLFYGLRQEVLARGGPIDSNHYWYEFFTRFARMRVDGTLTGEDGNLTQTELITFQFAAVLAPMFWALRPLFVRQKRDILADDTALLEREYQLEHRGFRRHQTTSQRAVVYGGNGFFGRLLVDDLLRHTSAQIDIASRTGRVIHFPGFQTRVRFIESDLRDPASVRDTITGADLVIMAAGPFQGMPLTVLEACLAQKVPYIDIADDHDFVRRGYALLSRTPRSTDPIVLIGCSVVPGLSSLLTRFAQQTVACVVQTKISISPGTRQPRGPGSFACLLSTVGHEFTAPLNGKEHPVIGWTDPERVRFPPPLGERTAYRVVDIADHFVQRQYFQTDTVEFRIGSELFILNLLLSFLRVVKNTLHLSLNWLVPISRAFIHIAAPFGSTTGGVMVEVSGFASNEPQTEDCCVYALHGGERIPSVIPALAASMLLRGEIKGRGLIALPDWINRDQLIFELSRRGIQMAVRSQSADWSICHQEGQSSIRSGCPEEQNVVGSNSGG